MPIVFRHKGFRFFFYSNEGHPREPVHVHVRGEGGEAKLWVAPAISVAYSVGFDAKTLRDLCLQAANNSSLIVEAWNEHFS